MHRAPDRPRVVLDVEESSTAPGAVPLPDALWPRAEERWTQRYGLERLRLLGGWLRRLHDRPERPVPGSHRPRTSRPGVAVVDVREHLAAVPQPWGLDVQDLSPAHRTSLLQWADALADPARRRPDHVAHGRLGLDHVAWLDAPPGDLVVRAPGGLAAAHPALDVGWVSGDLIELVHRSRARGHDPAPYERLLAAFQHGYRGPAAAIGDDPGNDLDVHRAVALRVVALAAQQPDPEDADLDLRLARHLVEHCWAVASRA